MMINGKQLKYSNYKEQFKRLDKALNNRFYLEAMFIAYAIMEDRLTSILSYEGNDIKSKNYVTINKKLEKVKKIAERKNSLPSRYFSDSLIDEIKEWKEKRNSLIHALMRQSLTTEELCKTANDGKTFARQLTNKATSYRRAVERKKQKTKQ